MAHSMSCAGLNKSRRSRKKFNNSFTFVSSTLGRCALSAPASVSAERFAPRTGDCGVSGIVVSAATTVVARGREERCVGVAVSRFRK